MMHNAPLVLFTHVYVNSGTFYSVFSIQLSFLFYFVRHDYHLNQNSANSGLGKEMATYASAKGEYIYMFECSNYTSVNHFHVSYFYFCTAL